MPRVELTLLVGQYAQKAYLDDRAKPSLTETVHAFETYLPRFMPLPHPSWRSHLWMQKHRWFEATVLPVLRERVAALLHASPR
jgi:uracil-DNA glycosylase